MKELIEQGLITELTGNQNIQYVFNDSGLFSLTEYKVLKSQTKNFVKCSKVLYNGKIKLLYSSAAYKSFRNMLPTIDIDTFLIILSNVLNCITDIKNNGFLSCNDLDLSYEKIFVDQNTLEVNLIYLPLNDSNADTSAFENELRSEFIKTLSGTPAFSGDKAGRVCSYLAKGTYNLNDVNTAIKNEITGGMPNDIDKKVLTYSVPAKQPAMVFSSVDASLLINFTINNSEFVIGKNAAQVDGVISFNKAISRVHCKISYQNGSYFITDLGSANGTYVNNSRIVAHQTKLLNSGDIIRLANTDFKVEF